MNISHAKHSSRSFHLASQRALEQRQIAPEQIEVLMVPGLVCEAFAVELGIKALVLAKGKSLKCHDLEKLFDALDDAEQTAIEAFVGISGSEFREQLQLVAFAFQDWRYIYEKQEEVSINFDFLQQLSYAVQLQMQL